MKKIIHRLLPQTLQNKFFLGLIGIMILMGSLFAIGLNIHTKELYTSEAREKATLMMAQTEATQKYIREVLRPKISQMIPPEDFVIEAMSTSYVSRKILSTLSSDEKNFVYRRVAKNARNPEYEVNDEEEKIFNIFANDSSLKRLEKIKEIEGKGFLSVARPIYFDKGCMWCHGKPEDAPKLMLELYGTERGFFRQEGELAGIEYLSVLMHNPSGSLGRTTTFFALWFASGMLILFLFIQLFFNRLVVFNLKRVAEILQRTFSLGKNEEELLKPLEKEEEIEGMINAIELIAGQLGEAREKLNAYARNLEDMVQERTKEMKSLLIARSADVNLFINLLEDLNQNTERKALLNKSLSLISEHFGASSAFYACAIDNTQMYVWPPTKGKNTDLSGSDLPKPFAAFTPDKLHLRVLERPIIAEDHWIFPIKASGHTRGFMGLYWGKNNQPSSPISVPLAFTFGSQLGIALDNLDAINALLNQNNLLDSLVEGVPDPLILADRNNLPLISNSSARELAERLYSLTCSIVKHKKRAQRPGSEKLNHQLQALLDCFGLITNDNSPKNLMPIQRSREFNLSDGSSFVVAIYPLQRSAYEPARNVIHIRETTNEKAILDHLRHNEKLAAVGQLAASIAHEINNPLGVIRCYAELLENSAVGEQQKEDIAIILKHVDGARNVLSDLLSFARPRAEKYEKCDINKLLNSLFELLKPKVSKAHIIYRLDLKKKLPEIYTDSSILEQVLVNLLFNTIDAIIKKKSSSETDQLPSFDTNIGEIIISADYNEETEKVYINIADTGGGIDDGDLSKIFDPFFTTKSIGEGTGLGLAIAFGMVREMGGIIEVKNRYSEFEKIGAVFTIILPLMGKKSHDFAKNKD